MKKLFVVATLVGFSFCVANAQTTPAQIAPAAGTQAPAKREAAPAKKQTTHMTTSTATGTSEATPAKKGVMKKSSGKRPVKMNGDKMQATPAATPAEKK